MDIRDVLEQVRSKEMSIEDAERYFQKQSYEEMGYAKLDTYREIRSGFPEVVFCARKADEHLKNIYLKLYKENGEVFGTRASRRQYEVVRTILPQVTYDDISHILKIEKPGKKRIGKIAVCTAGTADIPVAEEAAQTAEFFGANVDRIYDVGVSGIHRMLSYMDEIQSANCVVAAAGMEGALASVLGGLVSRPVIAVPTSVGYGASMNGLSALLTMINSCANGIAVVNIDNGYGAGYIATQINRLAVNGGTVGEPDELQEYLQDDRICPEAEEQERVREDRRCAGSLPQEYICEEGRRAENGAAITGNVPETSAKTDVIYRLETNIDDCSGESLGYVMDLLLEAGARDVHYTPVYMKKSRPAYQLNVICDAEKTEEMENIIFRETTTIGVRRIPMERTILERRIVRIQTSIGEAVVKVCTLPDGKVRCYPEYESVRSLSAVRGISYQEAYEIVRSESAVYYK